MDTSNSVRISICILNWQNYPDTENCLNGILDLPELHDSQFHVDVLVIDNGSQDHSLRKLQQFVAGVDYQNMHILSVQENRGYAAGNNVGIKYALESLRPSYLWILNSDTIPLPGSLASLVAAATGGQCVAIWGSSLIEQDTERSQCAGGYYYNAWLGTINPALAGVSAEQLCYRELDRNLDYISGAAMFVRADVFLQVGLLNENFFLYYEELDLVHRLLPGDRIDWCPTSIVMHRGGASMHRKGRQRSRIAEYYSILSSLNFTKKYYPMRLLTVVPILFFGKLGVYAFNNEIRLIAVCVRAFGAFFRQIIKN